MLTYLFYGKINCASKPSVRKIALDTGFSPLLSFEVSAQLKSPPIDLFRLYILFSQYRSCDDTQEI